MKENNSLFHSKVKIKFRPLVFFFILQALIGGNLFAQNDSIVVNKKRLRNSILTTSVVYAGTLYSLNQLWYADFDRTNFHFFNDNKQWNQMDKIGHIYSSYLGGAIGHSALIYSGLSNKKSTIYGGGLGFLFLTTVEIFDGYSKEWGFSWGDVISNGIGTTLFMSQQLLFEKQIVQPKYSFTSSRYRSLRPEILGSTRNEAYLKDYNGQTYWFSVNLNSIQSNIKPQWLNFALGYGSNGMLGGSGDYIIDDQLFSPYRQYYLSFDIDLTRIKTKSKIIKGILKAGNFIKIPAPTLEFNQGRNSKFYWLFF